MTLFEWIPYRVWNLLSPSKPECCTHDEYIAPVCLVVTLLPPPALLLIFDWRGHVTALAPPLFIVPYSQLLVAGRARVGGWVYSCVQCSSHWTGYRFHNHIRNRNIQGTPMLHYIAPVCLICWRRVIPAKKPQLLAFEWPGCANDPFIVALYNHFIWNGLEITFIGNWLK